MNQPFSISKDLETIIHKNFTSEEDCNYVIQELKTLNDLFNGIGERVFAGVLKLSGNSMNKFKESMALAKTDWRDLLMNADFAEDINAHKKWIESESKN